MKIYFYIAVVITFLSCESKTNYEKPEDLIPKDEMIDLLTDMHFVNGITGVKSKDGLKANDYMSVLYEKYQIDSTRFAVSNLYYVSNVSEYEKMFMEVEKRIKGHQRLFTEDSIMSPDFSEKKFKRPKKSTRNKDSILK